MRRSSTRSRIWVARYSHVSAPNQMRCRPLPFNPTRGWKRLAITLPSNSRELTSISSLVSDCLRSALRGRECGRRSAYSVGTGFFHRSSIPHIAPDGRGGVCGVSLNDAVCASSLYDFSRRSCTRRERFERSGSLGMLRFRIPQGCIHHRCRSSPMRLVVSFLCTRFLLSPIRRAFGYLESRSMSTI